MGQRILSFIIASTFFITGIKGQDSIQVLSNITITASLLEQQQKETGRNVISIRGEYFKALAVHSLDELLRYLPGVEVQQRGPQGAQSNIILRGGTFQQVLVIIDGIRLNDPLTGHFNSYIPLNPAEIERIEILKGSAAAIYGSEAVGGVINIISRSFHQLSFQPKKEFRGQLTAGEYALLNGEAYGRIATSKSVFSAGFHSNNANGPDLRGTDGFFHLHNASLSMATQISKNWIIRFRTAADIRSFNAQNFFTTFASDTAREKVKSWWHHLRMEIKTRKGSLQLDAGYKQLRDEYWFRPAAVPNDNRTNLFTTQAYYHATMGRKSDYTTGIQLMRKTIRSNDRGNHRLWHGALYSIFHQQAAKNFHLHESIRLDWDENYGVILAPQFNMAWSPSKFSFRLSAGRSFRDADFTERFNNYNKTLVTSGSIGNPSLQPEHSWNLEAGMDYRSNHGWQIRTTIFRRWHRNLIDWAPTPYAEMPRKENLSPSGAYSLARNLEHINTTGLEIDWLFKKKLSTHSSITGTLGYTFIRSANEDAIPSFYISSHARHLFNFTGQLSFHSFSAGINGLYKERNSREATAIGARISPSYFIMGSKISYRLPGNHFRFYFQGDNIFNKRYSDLLGSSMPGRWLSGGIEITL